MCQRIMRQYWVATTLEAPRYNLNQLPYSSVGQRERGRPPLICSFRYDRQRNLHTRLVLDSIMTNRLPHLPARILKVYREALPGFQLRIPSRWF